MKNAPMFGYSDAKVLGGFTSVRAYDPDQVDGLCIQTPDCVEGLIGMRHGDFCPLFRDYSSAPEEVVREYDY